MVNSEFPSTAWKRELVSAPSLVSTNFSTEEQQRTISKVLPETLFHIHLGSQHYDHILDVEAYRTCSM